MKLGSRERTHQIGSRIREVPEAREHLTGVSTARLHERVRSAPD